MPLISKIVHRCNPSNRLSTFSSKKIFFASMRSAHSRRCPTFVVLRVACRAWDTRKSGTSGKAGTRMAREGATA
eukprot:5157907-Amphidinium_carterae.1